MSQQMAKLNYSGYECFTLTEGGKKYKAIHSCISIKLHLSPHN